MPKAKEQRVTVESSTVAGLNIIKDKKQRALLESNIRRMRELNVQAAAIKKEKEQLSVDIECVLTDHSIKKIEFDGITANCYTSSNSQIKKDLLLMAGVSPAVILACTKSKEFSVVTVRVAGEKDGE